jgi:hypothetical protein
MKVLLRIKMSFNVNPFHGALMVVLSRSESDFESGASLYEKRNQMSRNGRARGETSKRTLRGAFSLDRQL